MKKIKYILILLFAIISIYGGVFIVSFNVKSEGNSVIVEWQTQNEVNIKEYWVLRKSNNSDFEQIAVIAAKGGNNSYKYIDKEAYKATEKIYRYKLRIINTSGEEDGMSEEKNVLHNVSSVKRTWGSIKALFR